MKFWRGRQAELAKARAQLGSLTAEAAAGRRVAEKAAAAVLRQERAGFEAKLRFAECVWHGGPLTFAALRIPLPLI